jgi:hypothetical protein
MKKKLIFVFILFFSSFGIIRSADAYNAWRNFHWARTSNPFTLTVGDNVSSGWDSYLKTAALDWTQSKVLDIALAFGKTNNTLGYYTPRFCKATKGRVEVCSHKYGSTGWLGVASVWTSSGGHITAGTVKMNDSYFSQSKYNTPEWKNLVMCQEIGHTLGLAHQDENISNANLGSCMDYTSRPATNQHPNAMDYSTLEYLYKHLDSANSYAKATTRVVSAQSLEDSNNPRDWGREIFRSENRRTSLFEKKLGDGGIVFRHVFWVEPQNDGQREQDHKFRG